MKGNDSNNLACCYRDNVRFNLYTKFCVPKLYHYAVNGNWDKIPGRCISHPKEVTFVNKYPPYDTALHKITRPSPGEMKIRSESDSHTLQQLDTIKMEAINALLQTNPNVVNIQDSFGRTPLHLACMDICIEDIAITILQAYPTAVSMKDIEQRMPLHLLCARNNTIPINLLILLLEKNPNILTLEDANGDKPIDIINFRKQEISNVDEVITILKKYSVE